MSNKPSIEDILLNELNSVYCDNCSSDGLNREDDDYNCGECNRKSMMWGLSEPAAKRIAIKIRSLSE